MYFVVRNFRFIFQMRMTKFMLNLVDILFINPEQYEIANLSHFGATSIPNMKPFKVYRKRECRTNLVQGEKESTASFIARQRAALSSYESSKKRSFASDMGTMWFRYTETYEDSKYSMDEPDEMQLYSVYSNPLLEL